jgi:hypothetical protein
VTHKKGLPVWKKRLYALMARNTRLGYEYFGVLQSDSWRSAREWRSKLACDAKAALYAARDQRISWCDPNLLSGVDTSGPVSRVSWRPAVSERRD